MHIVKAGLLAMAGVGMLLLAMFLAYVSVHPDPSAAWDAIVLVFSALAKALGLFAVVFSAFIAIGSAVVMMARGER